ncbi:EAL domain-containing protein [Pseudomonas sp. MWU12-2323]|uniref:EAL domain-containing protein n=1 Tax=Pseudomonas sp. MWU12-2323 TaxID=2651296 RepID=UPI00128CE171|nr:EAL domain-containing protein [Pseudomonas sp. MWU12-2323]MPQ69301.1 EAL domain-containing protein [Pseudomonas sp. MWU12-2323]
MRNPPLMDAMTLPLYTVYQPVVRMTANPFVYAYESLLRVGPTAEDHSTMSVIANAEQNGTMPMLDTLIAKRVCADIASISDMRLWINLSQRTMSNPNAAQQIATLIAEHNLTCRISIEMTETAAGNEALILESLRLLKSRHVSVVIDDIDDGHAKSHLLRTDLIAGCKLSRRSTVRMRSDAQQLEVASKLVSWCQANGKTVVMEGIENEEELAMALQLGVDYCQGFYFWEPVPLAEIPAPGSRFKLPEGLRKPA